MFMDIDHQCFHQPVFAFRLRSFSQKGLCLFQYLLPNGHQGLSQPPLIAPLLRGKLKGPENIFQNFLLTGIFSGKGQYFQARRGGQRQNIFFFDAAAVASCQKHRVEQVQQLHIGKVPIGHTGRMQDVGIDDPSGTGGKGPVSVRRGIFHAAAFHIKQLHRLVPVPRRAQSHIPVQVCPGGKIGKIRCHSRQQLLLVFIPDVDFFQQLYGCHAPCLLFMSFHLL